MLDQILKLSDKKFLGNREDRILAQLRFAWLLAEKEDGAFDGILREAAETASSAFADGLVTDVTVEAVERILSPLAKKAKEYKVICPAHAHIDMNWMWAYDETVMVTLDTFRTMLQILKEYPRFKFSQSQASVYRIVEQYEPEMLNEIKRYIKEGRWEVTASTWVEADKNMPTGESFARHALYTKEYLSKLLDIDPDTLNIDFEPDTFGHSRNIPEISAKAGVKYYYHCRGNNGGSFLYRWKSPSGAELMVYRDPYFYNSYIDSSFGDGVVEIAEKTGSKTILKVYGVGDHGGGPTRRDIEKLLEMDSWPIYPEIRLGTFGEYFTAAEAIRETLPVEDAEINFICDGCYSSQSRITAGNIRSERNLRQAEALTAFGKAFAGGRNKDYFPAWEKVLFNHFHDILTGSGVIHTREYACGEYQEVAAATKAGTKQALLALCGAIDTSALPGESTPSLAFGAGVGAAWTNPEASGGLCRIFHLYNSAGVPVNGPVEVCVWDYEGDKDRLRFCNTAGARLKSQQLDSGHYWGHNFTNYLVLAEVPAFGYTTVYTEQEPVTYIGPAYVNEMRRQKEETFILENDLVRAVIDPYSGAVTSLVDKDTGKERIDAARGGAYLCIIDEANAKSITNWNSSMSAWFVGRHKRVEPVGDSVELVPSIQGELRNAVQYKTKLRDSFLTVEMGLDEGSRDLRFQVNCDWREFGDDNEKIPSLAFYVPLKEKADSYLYDVPFGVMERGPMNLDRPANSFVYGGGLMLVSEARYGFRCFEDSMCLKLLRSSTNPDPIPEICQHEIQFSLCAAAKADKPALVKRAMGVYTGVQALSGTRHSGTMHLAGSLLRHEGSGVVSAVKTAQDGSGIVVRLYEAQGEASVQTLCFTKPVKSAKLTDLTERRVYSDLPVTGGKVVFSLAPNTVATVIVEF